jgi:hypothetical protein
MTVRVQDAVVRCGLTATQPQGAAAMIARCQLKKSGPIFGREMTRNRVLGLLTVYFSAVSGGERGWVGDNSSFAQA